MIQILITASNAIITDGVQSLHSRLKDSMISYKLSTCSRLGSSSTFKVDWSSEDSVIDSGLKDHHFDWVINTCGLPYQMETIARNPYKSLVSSNILIKNILNGLSFTNFIHISSPSTLKTRLLSEAYVPDQSHILGEIKLSEDIIITCFCREKKKTIFFIKPQSVFSVKEEPRSKNGHMYSEMIYKILIERPSVLRLSCKFDTILTLLDPNELWLKIANIMVLKPTNFNMLLCSDESFKIIDFILLIFNYGLERGILKRMIVIDACGEVRELYNCITKIAVPDKIRSLVLKYLEIHVPT